MSIMLESSRDSSAAVRSAVQSLDAELPLRDVSTLSAALEHQTWFLPVFSKVFGSFAFIGLVMASVGIASERRRSVCALPWAQASTAS